MKTNPLQIVSGPGAATNVEEERLVRACLQGDRNAQHALVQQVYGAVFSTVSHYMNGNAFVDDVVQEALLQLLRTLHQFNGQCALSTWARKIAIRKAGAHVRTRRRRSFLLGKTEVPLPVEPFRVEDAMDRKQLGRMLNGLLGKLPEKQHGAIQLRYVHELSYREISQIVDAPEETVRSRIKKGRATLKRLVSGHPAFDDWMNSKESL